eukprot:COSAG02_NODE_6358_length_3627_cov_4.287698_3_plen_58_part_00
MCVFCVLCACSHTAADILDVSELQTDPTSYTLKTLGNGQEIWVPLGRGEPLARFSFT